MYGDFHYKDMTVVRPSYLYNGNPYIGKTASLYWEGPLVVSVFWPVTIVRDYQIVFPRAISA